LHIPGGRGQNNRLLRSLRLACLFGFSALALVALGPSSARAQSCMTLQYSFQPDCYRPDASSACVQSVAHMDLGPQVAVWLQDSTGAFVDTLMVTNATAVRGIGNRPGRWDFLSGPLFPYGKRLMSLPIWAHARNITYDTVIMQEETCAVGGPAESCLGWHESFSSTELYFCRPLQQGEAQTDLSVDVITCPTKFNSEKGMFDPTTPSYYPPRSDLTSFAPIDGSAPPMFAAINDLDAVAAATPSYGALTPYVGSWSVPSTLPPGDYTLMVEVNKEYDSNASHMHPDFDDGHLPGYGTDGNFGQPSVVYQVPIHIDVTNGTTDAQATSQILGYGDWTGATGIINPRDATISTTTPGSGEGRLLLIGDSTSGLTGRVLATIESSSVSTAPPGPVTDLTVPAAELTATSAALQFTRVQSSGVPAP
jgi:hypothetical protein